VPNRSCACVHVVEPNSTVAQRWDRVCLAANIRTVHYASQDAFLREYRPQPPECVIAEVDSLDGSGLAILQEVLARHWPIPIIAASSNPDPELIVKAMQWGAIDYFPHSLEDQQLLAKIDHALEVDKEIKAGRSDLAAKLALLSPRENEVLDELLMAANTIQIAHRLGIGPKTVEKHRTNIFTKLEISSVPELMRLVWYPRYLAKKEGLPFSHAATPIP
jgi:two-component system response regulator FixJ